MFPWLSFEPTIEKIEAHFFQKFFKNLKITHEKLKEVLIREFFFNLFKRCSKDFPKNSVHQILSIGYKVRATGVLDFFERNCQKK